MSNIIRTECILQWPMQHFWRTSILTTKTQNSMHNDLQANIKPWEVVNKHMRIMCMGLK